MKQEYIDLDILVKEKWSELSLDSERPDWDEMNALLQEQMPLSPRKKGLKNGIFWGIGLLIIILFFYQQYSSTNTLHLEPYANRNIEDIKQSRLISPEVHQISTPSVKYSVPQPKNTTSDPVPLNNKKVGIIEDEGKKMAIPVRTQVKAPEYFIQTCPTTQPDDVKSPIDGFGVPTDSIIYDNLRLLKKKKQNK